MMTRTLFALALLLGSVVLPCSAQNPSAPLIRPGDVLRVAVWREPALSGDLVVSMDGTVSHPIYRELNVNGKTLPEVEVGFRQVLSRLSNNPQFVIEQLVRIDVAGEVRVPNLYLVSPLTTISQVVTLAGGATNEGKRDQVRVTRTDGEIIVDLTQNEGFAQAPVRSGDHIYVERRRSIFRDYIAPIASVAAALTAVANIILNQ
jgi:protein involved in polysaccharide export with SLBB domain